jgi:hypothetical protein
LHAEYLRTISNKGQFISAYKTLSDEVFGLEVKGIAKELLLDASECENAFYSLPRLTRDCFSKKALFNSIEKQILNLHSGKFQYPSSQRAVGEFKSKRDRIHEVVQDPRYAALINNMLATETFTMQMKQDLDKQDLQMDTLRYILQQFQSLCKANAFKLFTIRNKVRGKSAFLFLEQFMEIQANLKLLLKKVVSNSAIQESFKELL